MAESIVAGCGVPSRTKGSTRRISRIGSRRSGIQIRVEGRADLEWRGYLSSQHHSCFGARPAPGRSCRQAEPLHRSSSEWNSDRVPLRAERQSPAWSKIRLQASVDETAEPARRETL